MVCRRHGLDGLGGLDNWLCDRLGRWLRPAILLELGVEPLQLMLRRVGIQLLRVLPLHHPDRPALFDARLEVPFLLPAVGDLEQLASELHVHRALVATADHFISVDELRRTEFGVDDDGREEGLVRELVDLVLGHRVAQSLVRLPRLVESELGHADLVAEVIRAAGVHALLDAGRSARQSFLGGGVEPLLHFDFPRLGILLLARRLPRSSVFALFGDSVLLEHIPGQRRVRRLEPELCQRP